jgi:hypothetical protein
MAMLMGLVAGPLGRRDLPAALSFPPKDLKSIMTKNDFYFRVSDYLANFMPLGPNPSLDETYFFGLAQQAVFVNVILGTVVPYAPRFELEGNWYLDKSSGASPQPRAKVMLRETPVDVIPALLHASGFQYTKLAVFCKHGRDGKPRATHIFCQDCVQENSGAPLSEESKVLYRILVVISMLGAASQHLRLLQGSGSSSSPKNVMDLVYYAVDVNQTRPPGDRLAFLNDLETKLTSERAVNDRFEGRIENYETFFHNLLNEEEAGEAE